MVVLDVTAARLRFAVSMVVRPVVVVRAMVIMRVAMRRPVGMRVVEMQAAHRFMMTRGLVHVCRAGHEAERQVGETTTDGAESTHPGKDSVGSRPVASGGRQGRKRVIGSWKPSPLPR